VGTLNDGGRSARRMGLILNAWVLARTVRAGSPRSHCFSQRPMNTDFVRAVSVPDNEIDLARAALLYARDAYRQLDPAPYLAQLDAWAETIRLQVAAYTGRRPFDPLNELIFDRLHFAGNTFDYGDPRNSYLNEVIDRRTGLPILLSTIYLEVGWRLQLPLSGVGLPGHFLVRYDSPEETWFVDPFHRGAILSEDGCASLMRQTAGGDLPFSPEWLQPVTRRQILSRMLNNLRAVFIQREMFAEARPVLERLADLDPTSAEVMRDLGLILFRLGAYHEAINRLESYFALNPYAGDIESMRQVIAAARGEITRWN